MTRTVVDVAAVVAGGGVGEICDGPNGDNVSPGGAVVEACCCSGENNSGNDGLPVKKATIGMTIVAKIARPMIIGLFDQSRRSDTVALPFVAMCWSYWPTRSVYR